jgi:hypothetical protein
MMMRKNQECSKEKGIIKVEGGGYHPVCVCVYIYIYIVGPLPGGSVPLEVFLWECSSGSCRTHRGGGLHRSCSRSRDPTIRSHPVGAPKRIAVLV